MFGYMVAFKNTKNPYSGKKEKTGISINFYGTIASTVAR